MNRDAITQELSQLVEEVPLRFNQIPVYELEHKPAPGKWSKKEILGHLVDSAVHNLTRFTQAQYLPSPFVVVAYNPDELVKLNGYQQQNPGEIGQLWQALNRQIVRVISHCSEEKLNNTVVLPNNASAFVLGWIMEEYLRHLKHHLQQIFVTKAPE